MTSRPIAISASRLTFSYGNIPVLHGVNFAISEGETIGIIGPNGGGKTTLLKLIMGFLTPDAGEIRIFQRPQKQARELMAYVPQRLPFDKDFPISVMEVVLTGRLNRMPWYGAWSSEDKEAACAALEQVALSEWGSAPFGSLSGGQAQRVLIARALVSKPRLLLLDEPTSSIDMQAQQDIYHLLQELRGTITILMVTHDLNTVIQRVDRVLCVQGQVLPLAPQEVCEHFAFGLYHPPLIPGEQP